MISRTTAQDVANSAAELWLEQNFKIDGWNSKDSETIYLKLVALGPTPDPDAVVEIVDGIKSWSYCFCDECFEFYNEIFVFDEADAALCRKCLQIALELGRDIS